jgi:lipase chaperone LimK
VKAQRNDDAEKQRAEYEKKVQEEMTERIQIFADGLNVDDFQKEIIKQKMHSFYDERKSIYMDASLKYFERDEQLKALEYSHFSDIKEMISEETMSKIQSFIKDAGSSIKNEKKKKKKKKN